MGGNYKQRPPITHQPNIEVIQILSQEEKILFFQKISEILPTLQNISNTYLLYLLILTSNMDDTGTLTVNYEILNTAFHLLSNAKELESNVIGKYVKIVEDLHQLYTIGGEMMNLFDF